MRIKHKIAALLALSLCAFALQGCFSFGPFSTSTNTGSANATKVVVVQNAFSGTIYATAGHNIFSIAGNGTTKLLVGGRNNYDPTISPDGKTLAFVRRYNKYSEIYTMPASGGKAHLVISGNGSYFTGNGGFLHTHAEWFFEPSWSPDGKTLLFLSDLGKLDYHVRTCQSQDADMLDLMVYSVKVSDPTTVTDMAYADFGGGGDRDPSFNPTNPNEIIYTHYADIPSDSSTQPVQLMLADARLITENPGVYCGARLDTGISITKTGAQNIQPAFSPDGKSVAYVRNQTAMQTGIYVMPLPNSNVTATPNDAASEKTALSNYSKSAKLMEGNYYSRPTWAPDSKQMAYLAEQNQELDLWVVGLKQDATTGAYNVSGSAVEVTSSGIDGDSRYSWHS